MANNYCYETGRHSFNVIQVTKVTNIPFDKELKAIFGGKPCKLMQRNKKKNGNQ
jgi:hypothetical protein